MLQSEINIWYWKQRVRLVFEKCNAYWYSRWCRIDEATLHTSIWCHGVTGFSRLPVPIYYQIHFFFYELFVFFLIYWRCVCVCAYMNNPRSYIYIYIYIYKIIALMVKKIRQAIWRWKYTTNHCQGGKIYVGKKRKGQPCHTNWKKSKVTQLVGQKKKTPLGLLSYNAKSAQY